MKAKKKVDITKDPLVKFTEDGGAVVALKTPLKVGKEELTDLTFHAPLVEDVEAQGLAENELQQARYLVASLTNVSVNALRKMPYKDFERLVRTAYHLVDGASGKDESTDDGSSGPSDDES